MFLGRRSNKYFSLLLFSTLKEALKHETSHERELSKINAKEGDVKCMLRFH